ncbi:sigma-70 family RNA polymerase sigma factor [Dehalococcoidia bacterium]|nr:sigma-70 family RNA polymerase sigma factor [Dehalococcoidia bacterium]MCL0038657.1 sigma-70 family RNA polymerase sigma factor [Dehalococcoidia bacterium]MCL0073838.1 sigma-70 family RNA polymerase sigma factor [Dehalococcoidia bacterium]MCL0082329.1 sigma-70 family RNA polymerase sigma factor [Dehalococcoidia bacterium]MCL0095015.1 sigma-70 family RNA polymerase sigma factor [Dehalococcoidia bacterium]
MPTYEEELIQQSKDGDLDSFNQLVERYQGQVYNLAMRMLGNRQDAEDATQEIFILSWKAIGSFRGGTFRTWIFRVAARFCTDEVRRRRGRQVDSLDAMFPEHNPLPSSAESPEDHLLREDLSQLISQHLLCLAEEQRLVVTLADLQGFTYEEIAQITNSSIGTVKSRLNRGRANLRDLLLKNRELLPPEFRLYK